jgi:hypothetical protein
MTKYTEDRLHMTSEFPEIQQFYITYQCSVKQTVLQKFVCNSMFISGDVGRRLVVHLQPTKSLPATI